MFNIDVPCVEPGAAAPSKLVEAVRISSLGCKGANLIVGGRDMVGGASGKRGVA